MISLLQTAVASLLQRRAGTVFSVAFMSHTHPGGDQLKPSRQAFLSTVYYLLYYRTTYVLCMYICGTDT